MQSSWSGSGSGSICRKTRSLDMDTDQHLPTYDPLSHVAQRHLSRLRSAQNAISVSDYGQRLHKKWRSDFLDFSQDSATMKKPDLLAESSLYQIVYQ
ncbi:unnamed protein product [Sphenostylis stenocarpa]|uniref:Uncharacterized protein n=1 Tax=Sphenostylis stenocarpa TaxID=92480 RepID=A0AA86S083_9FABA|nr:unnamed protein product [Sphenostylis stenocarpa]